MTDVDLSKPTGLTLPDVPASITREAVVEWLALIGIPAKRLCGLTVELNGIRATVYAEHPKHGGRYLLGPDIGAAKHEVVIPILDGAE